LNRSLLQLCLSIEVSCSCAWAYEVSWLSSWAYEISCSCAWVVWSLLLGLAVSNCNKILHFSELSLEVQRGQDYFRFVEGTCIIALCLSSLSLSLSLSVLSAAFSFWTVTSVGENEEKANTIQPPPVFFSPSPWFPTKNPWKQSTYNPYNTLEIYDSKTIMILRKSV